MSEPVIPHVNFLRQRRRRLQKLRQTDSLLFFVLGSVLAVVVLFTIGLAGANYYFLRQVQEVQAAQQQHEGVIKRLATQEAEYLLFTTRLSAIDQIFTEYTSQRETLAFLSQLVTPEVEFREVTFAKQKKTLTFTVVVRDLPHLENFLDRLRSPEIQQQTRLLSVSGIQRRSDGSYSLEATVQLQRKT